MRSFSRFRPVLIALLALTAALALTACNADTEPATNVTSTSAVLHADGNGEKGEVVTFWFRYREVGTQAWQETQHIGPTGEFGGSFTNADLTATVTGLKPATTYEYFLCGTLHKPYEAGTAENPICFDDVKGPTNQVSTFTTDEAPVTNYTLNVSKAGSGSGTITGSGISCGSDCSQSYASGTSVTLTAAAASGSTFAGWSGGGCSGTGSCVVSMTQARSVTATFNTTAPQGDDYLPSLAGQSPVVIWAVGDGADGSGNGVGTGQLVANDDPDRFIYLGDVYNQGTASEYQNNYKPAYGALDSIAAPTIGNHEYGNRSTGYNPYWTNVHGSAPEWFSFQAAGWQLLSLNSEASHTSGSAQMSWLKSKIQSGPQFGDCRIAFWHRPYMSEGPHGDYTSMKPIWDELAGDAKMVLNGHDHSMQAFKPVDGITELVSGAGGHGLSAVESSARLAFSKAQTRGAVKMTLSPGSLTYQFYSTAGAMLYQNTVSCNQG